MTTTMKTGEMAVSRSGATEVTVEQAQAAVAAKVQSAYDSAMAQIDPNTVAPARWWDLYAYGPFKAPLAPFPAPNQVVRIGEKAFVTVVLYLSQLYPNPSAAEVLATFGLPFSISWDTNNVTSFTKETALSGKLNDHFIPGQALYYKTIELKPEHEGIHELNIRARITGCNGELAPPFAGYATLIGEIDDSIFTPGMHWRYQGPVRFDVYK